MPAISSTLKRGADPYADAEATARLCAPVLGPLSVDISGANSVSFVSPIAGRLKRVTTLITTAIGTGDAVISADVDGGTANDFTLLDTLGAGDAQVNEIPDTDDNNVVSEGSVVTLTSDGNPDAGVAEFAVIIQPLD